MQRWLLDGLLSQPGGGRPPTHVTDDDSRRRQMTPTDDDTFSEKAQSPIGDERTPAVSTWLSPTVWIYARMLGFILGVN